MTGMERALFYDVTLGHCKRPEESVVVANSGGG